MVESTFPAPFRVPETLERATLWLTLFPGNVCHVAASAVWCRVAEFGTKEDLDNIIRKFHDTEFFGRYIVVLDVSAHGGRVEDRGDWSSMLWCLDFQGRGGCGDHLLPPSPLCVLDPKSPPFNPNRIAASVPIGAVVTATVTVTVTAGTGSLAPPGSAPGHVAGQSSHQSGCRGRARG